MAREELKWQNIDADDSARISGSVPPGSPYDALASPVRSARSA
jgi:hypothetical protein